MSPKSPSDHLSRDAVVYVRQSTMAQVASNRESQRRQYALADQAKSAGFASVTIIDDDLGRSGSGEVERPGFQKLVAAVCGGDVGAVYCIEASRLARNGRDWHLRLQAGQPPAYHTIMQVLKSPIYAGAYAFGRRSQRTDVVDGRARKKNGQPKCYRRAMKDWGALLKDNHQGYITWPG